MGAAPVGTGKHVPPWQHESIDMINLYNTFKVSTCPFLISGSVSITYRPVELFVTA
jgi:hypothetical protein